ncbi:MAG: fibronectin type III domain-containing protein, partial [Mycobacterium sp.]|nr:fibronectin type III domain-containing protein [Mycobacterium sp.]
MALPATGGSWAEVIEPGLNPLATNYWQTTDILICDYFKANGTVLNLADPSVGLGTQGLFTPFAADGITIREDLLITAPTPNMGFYHIGLLKENQASHTLDQTIQETPSAQYIRTVRNVITKLEDKIEFQPIENTPLIHYLRNELPLVNGIPALGTPGLQIPRPNTDVLQERVIVLLGTDGAGTLFAKVFAHVTTDKKGKTELGRHAPESSPFT